MPSRRFVIIGVGLIIILGFASFLLLSSFMAAPHPRLHFSWMISQSAVGMLINAGLSTAQADAYFGGSSDYLLEPSSSNNPLTSSWQSYRVRSYTSYEAIAGAFDANAIDPSVQAILYDNEHWQFTPESEQEQPAYFEQRAADLVHAHHLLFITAPAADLVTSLQAPGTPGTIYAAYLQLKVAADAARYADVFVIQSQGSEANTSQFQNFVQQAATQAHSSNPNVIILAGLSTNPSGQQVTSDKLYQAVMTTQMDVNGYLLNVPGESPYCPRCGTPQPQVGVALLQQLW